MSTGKLINIRLFLFFLPFTIAFNLEAQKLPNKQEETLQAPDKVKIDGKATEWTFKAYNKATDVFYTIANDADNLYLTVKADDAAIIRKIISSGVTFSVNATGKKWSENTISVSYPVFNYKTKPYINFNDKPTGSGLDSFVLANNKRFDAKSKYVRTAGIAGIDSLISVYNGDGVRVAASFDEQMNYTYELALSLNHLKSAIGADGKLYYRVALNAIKMDDMPGINIVRDPSGNIQSVTVTKRDAITNSGGMNADTDFSDEYVLSK